MVVAAALTTLPIGTAGAEVERGEAAAVQVGRSEAGPKGTEASRLPSAALVPRVGVLVGGYGQSKIKCRGGCYDFGDDTTYVDRPTSVVDAGLLFLIHESLRLGPALSLHNTMHLDTELHDHVQLGRELDFSLRGEHLITIEPGMWLATHGEMGFVWLFPRGDTYTRLNAMEAACNRRTPGADCLQDSSLGFEAGIGGGWLLSLSRATRFRADLLFRFYRVRMSSFGGDGSPEQLSWSLTGVRSYLLVGMDLL